MIAQIEISGQQYYQLCALFVIFDSRMMRSIICESMPSDRVAMMNQHALRSTTEFSLFTTITASDYIISKIQRLQNKFIRLALRLPKYICSKLLHDSTGLPYVKDRLLSCATKSLDRIAQNLLVGESISSNRLNPAWDRFPTPLSVVSPVSPQDNLNCWGDLPKACHYLKQTVRPIYADTFWHSLRTTKSKPL